MLNDSKVFVSELWKRNHLLFVLGAGMSLLFMIFFAGFVFCEHSMAEVCHWLKPFKFTASFAMYAFTLGWILVYLKNVLGERRVKHLSLFVTGLILMEISLILFQSWQESNSYAALEIPPQITIFLSKGFNLLSDGIIVVNTFFAMYICVYFFKDLKIKPLSYIWGIRAGLTVFIISSFLGLFLLMHYGQVPVDPFHLGLPFTQLNSVRSNLITTHFIGIHYLQALPLCGYWMPSKKGMILISFMTLSYMVLCIIFVYQALTA